MVGYNLAGTERGGRMDYYHYYITNKDRQKDGNGKRRIGSHFTMP